jgi:UDP-N-acetylglucosamine--N-acetylmuramyl-(pentapeptide) pyrophosphoryl-undecaprenol N-acetylglucosamine transferase
MNSGSQNEKKGVLIMAGGTGGHIFPGLAVAESLHGHGIAVRWLGASGAMECQRVPAAGIELDTVDITGLRGKGIGRWLLMPWRLVRAVYHAFRLMGLRRPACAISFGGYAAGPGGLAAWLRGIPLLVHEQNRIPGMTNRVLAKLAKNVLQAFPGTWKKSLDAQTCGNPVRKPVVSLESPDQRLSGRTGAIRLLITGGSQGAQFLNQIIPSALDLLPPGEQPEIRHQAGEGRQEETSKKYREMGIEAEVCEFIDDMAGAYGWADLVVCRSGALTVSELAAAGVAAILVPFPFAVDDHQSRNAEFLVEAGAAEMMPEASCDPESMAAVLSRLFASRGEQLRMACAARAVSVPDSAERVAAVCMEFMPA